MSTYDSGHADNGGSRRMWGSTEMDDQREIQDVFMSPDEVMLYLKIGRTKCYEILQTSIPSYSIGRLRRVKKSDVDCWLESQRYAPWE